MMGGATPLTSLDLLNLALAKVNDGEARIQRIFEWQLERQSTFLNLTFPVAVSAFAALVSPFFKGDTDLVFWPTGVLLGVAVVAVGIAAVMIRLRANLLYRRYVAAIELYGLLRQLVL
jgi:threonine/homoserine/homoserine lactone efflux protein